MVVSNSEEEYDFENEDDLFLDILTILFELTGVPPEELKFHTHNTFGDLALMFHFDVQCLYNDLRLACKEEYGVNIELDEFSLCLSLEDLYELIQYKVEEGL